MMMFIPYKSLKQECKVNCKYYIIEIYGWSGSISVITAYTLTTIENDNLLLIDILNLYGSMAIGYMCFRSKVWQATLLEVAWFSVGIYSMINNLIHGYKDKCS